MSRALDQGVKEALKNGDHQAVYASISGLLQQTHTSLLEIELLGQAYPLDAGLNFIQERNAVAVPKLRLVQAFIVARQILQRLQNDAHRVPREILPATAVMMLMDPEHLTAANVRKRTLLSADAVGTEVIQRLSQEKYFIDSLLTSRLHRHTKSPTLWSHRRWLMGQFAQHRQPIDAVQDITNVVYVSAERHPRNYYAWCHARQLIDASLMPLRICSRLVDPTMKWCFRHHDDVSGWMFLLWLLDMDSEHCTYVFEETVKLARSFHWRNESIWYFLRNLVLSAASKGRLTGQFNEALVELQDGATANDSCMLKRTSQWVDQWSK